jgi:uncharacterized surface protein with fasciclin (FAS1) repeats
MSWLQASSATQTFALLLSYLVFYSSQTILARGRCRYSKLPEGTVASLLLPENMDKLVSILTYHVLSGEVMAETVVTMDGAAIATVNGASFTIGVKGGVVTVDDATVVTTNIKTNNGVIHVIDSVMIPNQARFSNLVGLSC